MASKQSYPCYVCKKAGFDDVRVYLDGKTEDGKTIYKNEDMSPHHHKEKQSRGINSATQAQQPQASTTIVTQATNESRILSKLQGLSDQISHLTKLVYVQTQLLQQKTQQQQEQDHNNPATLLDNR